MSIRDIGPLLGADEGLNHQIVDTFAVVSESDYAWTEKIWVSIAKADGSIQANFGLGKYQNRGIIDGFGGVSRGREQWTVRGSRELQSDARSHVRSDRSPTRSSIRSTRCTSGSNRTTCCRSRSTSCCGA